MKTEVLIVSGLMLILSGSVWLLAEARKKIVKPVSANITEAYRTKNRNNSINNIYKFLSLIGFWGGFYFWQMSDRNLWWTILCVFTVLWFLKVKKSLFLVSLMWLVAMFLAFININLGLIWLLTVIGTGYFNVGENREKQNIFTQLSVLLNPVSAIGVQIISNIKEIKYDELLGLTATETGSEGLIICPVCQETMKLFKVKDGEENVVYDRCPKCQAVFFDDRDHFWAILKSQTFGKQKNTGKYLCPRCQIRLRRSHSRLDPENAIVYSCPECLGNLLI